MEEGEVRGYKHPTSHSMQTSKVAFVYVCNNSWNGCRYLYVWSWRLGMCVVPHATTSLEDVSRAVPGVGGYHTHAHTHTHTYK